MVSAITAIIYPASADINNDESANTTTVRAFSWKVTASKYTGTQPTDFTTGPRLLPSDLSEGDYKLLVIANLDYASVLDGQTLKSVRDRLYETLPYSSSSSDPDKAYDPLYTKNFIMTSIKEVKLSLYSAPANGGIGNTGNTGNTDTIAISGTYSTCHMCTMRMGIDVGRVDYKVITIYVINKSITIIINTRLAVKLGLINPKVVLKVWVVDLETTVDDGNNHFIRASYTCLPCLEEVDVIAGNTALYASIVVVMPLVWQQWVVERHC